MLSADPRLLGYAASLASLGSGFIAVGAPRHDGKTGVVDIAHSSRLRTSAGRLFGENPGCLFGSAVAALVQWPRRAVVAVGEPCPEEPTGRVFIVEHRRRGEEPRRPATRGSRWRVRLLPRGARRGPARRRLVCGATGPDLQAQPRPLRPGFFFLVVDVCTYVCVYVCVVGTRLTIGPCPTAATSHHLRGPPVLRRDRLRRRPPPLPR